MFYPSSTFFLNEIPPKPYALVVDDIEKDAADASLRLDPRLERDIQIAKVENKSDGEMDILLTESDPGQKLLAHRVALPSFLDPSATIPSGQPMLLVRVLSVAQPTTTGTTVPKPESWNYPT